MTDPVSQRIRARADLLEQFVYFCEQASPDVAERYFAAVEETCMLLANQHHSGRLYDSRIDRRD